MSEVAIEFAWRGEVESDELEALHAAGFDRPVSPYDWRGQLDQHSLGWVVAREADGGLVGFVNVAWDGGVHAFLLDTLTAANRQRQGVATRLVAIAVEHARGAGCEWIHVDFDDHLSTFYFEACGFAPTPAGVIDLTR